MPRNYINKVCGRRYKAWTDDELQRALTEIKAKTISIREAAVKYGIHRNTLNNQIHGKTPKQAGGQTVLSAEEEKIIVSHVIALSTYGFPVTAVELRHLVKSYLTRIDRKVKKFKNNLPGPEWALSFLKRHKQQLNPCMSQAICRSRAGLSFETISLFFDRLQEEIKDVLPENIWNYDESNLQDNPGLKKVIVKRGVKHPDIIMKSTKASISIMMCGNAAGELAPPYVTYKAESLYQCWMEGGPPGTRYNRSKSGWFDSAIFEDWFKFLMLPVMKKKPGKKILIGDNLSSHLNYHVVSLCQANDITFIALPPHSTHLLQPLGVAFFRPMKGAWRQILTEWKETDDGRWMLTLPKTVFPQLFNMLIMKLSGRSASNLKSGFRACGIYPLDRNVVLEKLSDVVLESSDEHIENISNAFSEELKTRKQETCATQVRRRKKSQCATR